jgi:hypothetical protein
MEILKELTELKLAQIPVENPLLMRNAVFSFWSEVLAGHERLYRHGHLWGDDFPDMDSYLERHPGSEMIEQQNDELPYFKARRGLTREEAMARVAPEDYISSLLLATDLSIEQVSYAAVYWEACGDDRWQEIYLLRPLWFALLALTNITGHPLHLNVLNVAIRHGGNESIQQFELSAEGTPEELKLPEAALPKDATALIPIATILPPHQPPLPEVLSVSGREIEHARVQDLTHCAYKKSDSEHFLLWGPRLWPHSVSMQIEGQGSVKLRQSQAQLGDGITLSRASLSTRSHKSRCLAIPSVHPELPRRRRLTCRARNPGLLRSDPILVSEVWPQLRPKTKEETRQVGRYLARR